MAVYPDRIVLKNSSDSLAEIESAIVPGGTDPIVPGELVLATGGGSPRFYTLDENNNLITIASTTSMGRAIVSDDPPTVNLLGQPLEDGDLWYESDRGAYYVYYSGGWVEVSNNTTDGVFMQDLVDVNYAPTGTPAEGQFLAYDSTSSQWRLQDPYDFKVENDLNPKLGGNLNVNGYKIESILDNNAVGPVELSGSKFELVGGVVRFKGPGLQLYNPDNSVPTRSIYFATPFLEETYTVTYPTAGPTGPGQVLTTGSEDGDLVWADSTAGGTVTSVDGVGENGITVVGGPITQSGELLIGLTRTGVSEGRHRAATVVVDSYGRIIATDSSDIEDLGNVSLSGQSGLGLDGKTLRYNAAAGLWEPFAVPGVGTVTSVDVVGQDGIEVAGGPITAAGIITLSLEDSGVTPRSYDNPSITVDRQGRITAAVDGPNYIVDPLAEEGDIIIYFADQANRLAVGTESQILQVEGGYPRWKTIGLGGTVTSVEITGGSGISVTGEPITDSGSYNIALAASGVASGTYSNPTIQVDSTGRIISAENGLDSEVRWEISAPNTNGYIFTGPGFSPSGALNPDIYVTRGQRYVFDKTIASHPFAIQSTKGLGGTAYNEGITGFMPLGQDEAVWVVPMDAPRTLYYQCVIHSTMNGTIYVLDQNGNGDGTITVQERAGASGSPQNPATEITTLSFNTNNGFSVTDLGGGEALVNLGSAFAPWYVDGETTLDPEGEEPVEFVAGTGISITTDASADPKQIIFTAEGGSGGGIEEAPQDGTPYVRQDAGWVPAPVGDGGSGGGTTATRLSEQQVASSGPVQFTALGHSGTFVSVGSSADAWVAIYDSAASLSADSSRAFSEDPVPGSGVLLEVYVPAGGTVLATPGTVYFNNDTQPSETIYAAIRDQFGNDVAATVEITAYGNQVITSVRGGTFGSGL